MTPAARGTLLTVQIGFHGATIPRANVRDPVAHREDFHAQFMTGDSWIAIERHLAEEPAVIGPADADPMNPEQRFAGPGCGRFGKVEKPEGLRTFELECLHESDSGAEAPGRSLLRNVQQTHAGSEPGWSPYGMR
jgi:hypothetical protein